MEAYIEKTYKKYNRTELNNNKNKNIQKNTKNEKNKKTKRKQRKKLKKKIKTEILISYTTLKKFFSVRLTIKHVLTAF